MPTNASLPRLPRLRRGSVRPGVSAAPRENKTIIFDNVHQYHLHFFPARCSPPPRHGVPPARVCLQKQPANPISQLLAPSIGFGA